jgi:hypothetical protein
MSFAHTHSVSVNTDEGVLTYSKAVTADKKQAVDVPVADSESDYEILIAIDVSTVKSIYIVSDQDVTLETNDGGTPVDTISLKANVPYVWHTDSYDTLQLTTDVTAFYITNASGSTANIKTRVLEDSTPV